MILAIVGPTAVGKTKLSEFLAKKYDAIIINVDAVQVYKELNIGSAKPKENEMEDVPHYLFDNKSVMDTYTVADFQKDIRTIIDKNKDKNIILVGGSGLYVSAALYDYKFSELEKNNNKYDELSNQELYNLVKNKYPNFKEHINNRQRLISKLKKSDETNLGNKMIYDAKIIGLTTERDILYKKINERVLSMIEEGLINEVENLMQYQNKSRVLNTAIGYKEVVSYLKKECTKEFMIELIQKNSRHFAKRQYTWFNNKMDVKWFSVDYNDFSNTINEVDKYINAKKNAD